MGGKLKIAVAMSGGVDSSVAAALLAGRDDCQVVGVTMKLWPCAELAELSARGLETRADVCCSPRDLVDARLVCERLGIEHHVLDLEAEFSQRIIRPFIEWYLRGLTPNPCLWCNEHIKAKLLGERVRALGCAALATGHHARIERRAGRFHLIAAENDAKDQTYFLYPLSQAELAFLRFPLAGTPKEQVRKIARALALETAEKPESMETCFIRQGTLREFLRRQAPEAFRPGEIVLEDGRVIGRHDGLPGYTIGQRKGLGVAWREPLYVVKLDVGENRLVMGLEGSLWRHELIAALPHWIALETLNGPLAAAAKIRYRAPQAPCTVLPLADEKLRVSFSQPQRAITPGQAVVFYQGEETLGGAVIEQAL